MSSSDHRSLSRTLPSSAIVLGDRVFFQALFAGRQPYVFTSDQMEFLWALQQMKALAAAAIAVGKDEAWAEAFLRSPKFRKFRNAKLLEVSIRNGLTLDWWYAFGKQVTDGQVESWSGKCGTCDDTFEFNAYEIEEMRGDDLRLDVKCPVCYAPLAVTKKVEPFKPSREQVVAWQELGSRLSPKVERVHHSFDNVEMVFENEGGND